MSITIPTTIDFFDKEAKKGGSRRGTPAYLCYKKFFKSKKILWITRARVAFAYCTRTRCVRIWKKEEILLKLFNKLKRYGIMIASIVFCCCMALLFAVNVNYTAMAEETGNEVTEETVVVLLLITA